jgi:hypothetical protein
MSAAGHKRSVGATFVIALSVLTEDEELKYSGSETRNGDVTVPLFSAFLLFKTAQLSSHNKNQPNALYL